MLNEEPKVLEVVVPNLIAYHSILKIKAIMDTKTGEKTKEVEKAEREGRKVSFAPHEEEHKKSGMMTEEQIYKRRVE